MSNITGQDAIEIVARYVRVWSEPDPAARRAAVARLWSADGAEFVEGAAFRGHNELDARIAGAHEQFVAGGKYVVAGGTDASRHDDIVAFTIQLTTPDGELAWAARVFLLLDADGLIREDYQLTVKPLAAEA
jgi:hypothetical protein